MLYVALGESRWEWRGVLGAVAIISMIVGAVIGITQSDVKRMVAYSSVAHAGFIMLGAMSITDAGVWSTQFYLLAYGFTTLAVFGVISLVRGPDGEATSMDQWAGLAKRSPVAAAVMTYLLLSLTGIPLTSGFTAKFSVFAAALGDHMGPLVVVGLIASAIAAYYYFRLVVLMYFREPADDTVAVVVPRSVHNGRHHTRRARHPPPRDRAEPGLGLGKRGRVRRLGGREQRSRRCRAR